MAIERTEEQKLKLSIARKAARERRKARDLVHHREVARKYKRDGRGYFYSWAGSLKNRAKERGVPYDLDVDYLISITPTHCPVLGVEMVRRASKNDNAPWAPTVDRIIPANGYVKGNVIVVSKRANQIKSDASPDEIEMVAQFYRKLLQGM